MGTIVHSNRVEVRAAPPPRPHAGRPPQPVPWWLYPQVLSLDAPAIAVAWQWLFAKAFDVAITPWVLVVTASCVWMIYCADHVLDVRGGAIYSARHRFVERHFRKFVAAFGIVFAAGAVASSRLSAAIWCGGVGVTAVVCLYALVVHAGGDRVRRYWPKEFVIATVFAAGSSVATWTAGEAAQRAWPAIALFAALCTLNCTAVDCWEWEVNRVISRYPHRFTRWVARHFEAVAILVMTCAVLDAWSSPNRAVLAILGSTVLLIAIGRVRTSVSPEAARLLADVALLTPLLFLLR